MSRNHYSFSVTKLCIVVPVVNVFVIFLNKKTRMLLRTLGEIPSKL